MATSLMEVQGQILLPKHVNRPPAGSSFSPVPGSTLIRRIPGWPGHGGCWKGTEPEFRLNPGKSPPPAQGSSNAGGTTGGRSAPAPSWQLRPPLSGVDLPVQPFRRLSGLLIRERGRPGHEQQGQCRAIPVEAGHLIGGMHSGRSRFAHKTQFFCAAYLPLEAPPPGASAFSNVPTHIPAFWPQFPRPRRQASTAKFSKNISPSRFHSMSRPCTRSSSSKVSSSRLVFTQKLPHLLHVPALLRWKRLLQQGLRTGPHSR